MIVIVFIYITVTVTLPFWLVSNNRIWTGPNLVKTTESTNLPSWAEYSADSISSIINLETMAKDFEFSWEKLVSSHPDEAKVFQMMGHWKNFADDDRFFFCDRNSKEYFPLSKFNDDFCDCQNGFDEPGTNACLNSFFQCRTPYIIYQKLRSIPHNFVKRPWLKPDGKISDIQVLRGKLKDGSVPHIHNGYLEEVITLYSKHLKVASSKVADGICDCCDCTDEWRSYLSTEQLPSPSLKGKEDFCLLEFERVETQVRETVSTREKALAKYYHLLPVTSSENIEAIVQSQLAGNCFEDLTSSDQYSYKICFAGIGLRRGSHETLDVTASQFDKATRRNTNLGKKAILNGSNLEVNGGQICFSGKSRLFTITLRCSDKEALANTREPAMCEYDAELFLPLACLL